MTFLGFVDVYNYGKSRIYCRNLNPKRFEEGWFTWKIRSWIFKIDSINITMLQKLAFFKPENIERVIQENFENFQNTFINYWSNAHVTRCKNENKLCQNFCKF